VAGLAPPPELASLAVNRPAYHIGTALVPVLVATLLPACKKTSERSRQAATTSAMQDPGSPPVPAKRPRRPTPASGVVFDSEVVELRLLPDKLQVKGTYVFANHQAWPWRGRIGYPIAVTDTQPAPEQIQVEGVGARPVRCRTPRRCAAVLRLTLLPRDRLTVRLRYEQRLTARRAVYLVTTARKWHRPLREARFVIRHPTAWTGIKVSYPLDSRTVEGTETVLRFTKRNFLPQREVEVTWQPAP
jgi:hypothetical protein